MSDPLPIGPEEERLLRFVDGRLPPEEAAAVARELAERPALRERVAADLATDAEIRAAFAGVVEEPVPARVREALRRLRPPAARTWMRNAAVLLAVLALGAGGGWLAGRGTARPLDAAAAFPEEAVRAYVTYAPEVRHPVEVPATEEAHLVQWLSKRLGAPIKPPGLDRFGYALMGGRLLPAAAGPAAQFMYEAQDGTRLALYVTRNPGARETAFRFARSNDASAFWWIDDGLGYALIGRTDRARLLGIARAVYERLER